MTKLANLSCVLTQMEMLDGSGEIIGALFSIIVLSKNREVETSKFSMNESVRTVFSIHSGKPWDGCSQLLDLLVSSFQSSTHQIQLSSTQRLFVCSTQIGYHQLQKR